MKIQEAIREAMTRPISDLASVIIEREGRRGTSGCMFFTINEETRDLHITDWENKPGRIHACLYLEDILADDWIVGKYVPENPEASK